MAKKDNQKTIDALLKAKQAVDVANSALDAAIQELEDDDLNKVVGAGEFNAVPTVDEHRYPNDPGTKIRY